MTEVAAYYIAQNNDFSGNPSDYWIAAEAQISALYQ
jgi:beta-lactamase class D